MKILLIEDDKTITLLLKKVIKEQNFSLDYAETAKAGINLARVNDSIYDVIILDIMLPDMDGLSVCRQLREDNNKTPILIISARDLTDHKVEGLQAGADDYLSKPFELKEFIARLYALQRRNVGNFSSHIISAGNIELDQEAHEVKVKGRNIELTPIEFRILTLLIEQKGKVISRSNIIEKVWNMDTVNLFSNSVNVHIKKLRSKIKDSKSKPLITTVRNIGYKLVD